MADTAKQNPQLDEASRTLRGQLVLGTPKLRMAKQIGVNKKSIPSLLAHPHTVTGETREKFLTWFGGLSADDRKKALDAAAKSAPTNGAARPGASKTAAKTAATKRVATAGGTSSMAKTTKMAAKSPAKTGRMTLAKTAAKAPAKGGARGRRGPQAKQGYGASRAKTAFGGRARAASGPAPTTLVTRGAQGGAVSVTLENGRQVTLSPGQYHMRNGSLFRTEEV